MFLIPDKPSFDVKISYKKIIPAEYKRKYFFKKVKIKDIEIKRGEYNITFQNKCIRCSNVLNFYLEMLPTYYAFSGYSGRIDTVPENFSKGVPAIVFDVIEGGIEVSFNNYQNRVIVWKFESIKEMNDCYFKLINDKRISDVQTISSKTL